MFYRVKQFFLAIFARLTKEDYDFINKYLDEKDKLLFNSLPTHEKKHCINVAIFFRGNNNVDDKFIKAALLHDIGKRNSGLNPIFKGIIVIMNKISESATRKLQFIKPINVYYNHPYIGYELYKDIDEEIAYIIKNHHNYNCTDKIVKMLQEADCKN